MVPIKPAAVTFILFWSLIPILAVSESTKPGALDAETRDPPRRVGDDAGFGLGQVEPPSGDGQSPESVDPSGSGQDRDEAPSLGLCDGR